MSLPAKIVLTDALSRIDAQWRPHIVGEVNDCAIKLVKFQGEFVWHHHEHEDELFLVVDGEFTMRFREGEVTLKSGEAIIVPRGVEHCPYAEHETSVLLVEPRSTVNTGNVVNQRTVIAPPRLGAAS